MPRGIYPRRIGTSINAKHLRVKRIRGRAAQYDCVARCGRPAREWATIIGTDGMLPENYLPLCNGCHQKYDEPFTQRLRKMPDNRGRKRPDLAERNRARKLS